MMLDSLTRALTVFSFCAALLAGAAQARAQDEIIMPMASQAAPTPQTSIVAEQSLPPSQDEVTILRDEYAGKYNLPTLENLSRLYWRLGAFDFDDNVAVANFIKINDCKIYSDYLNDDMEWSKIVGAMKEHIKANAHTYPLNFQFMLRLHLGRYDPVRGGFPLVDKTGFIDANRIEVDSVNRNQDICYDSNLIRDYPRSAVLLLSDSFTFDFLKLDEHVAQAYILRRQSDYKRMEEEQRVREHERTAYLRLRISFSQYHGNIRASGQGSNEAMSILYGTLDGYEVFEDAGQKRLMLSVDLRGDANAPARQMSLPPSGNR
ncbi:MAG: DUF4852 domain-containing protein [Micavibrio sp.]